MNRLYIYWNVSCLFGQIRQVVSVPEHHLARGNLFTLALDYPFRDFHCDRHSNITRKIHDGGSFNIDLI
jgi:hypothetical protein